MRIRCIMAAVLVILLVSLLESLPGNSFDPDDDYSHVVDRQFERIMRLQYESSYNEFSRSSMFFTSLLHLPGESYRLYSFNTRLPRSFLPDFRFISDPIMGFIDYVPYTEYYQLIDQYYLSDITIFTISDWGDLRFNLRDLTQGDYFMKMNINFFRSGYLRR